MASAISSIYDSLTNMSVGSVTARNIDAIDVAVVSGDLPTRLLLPSTSGEMEFIAVGNLQDMNWSIRDLCLFAPVKAGAGVEEHSEDMVTYISNYINAVKSNRNPTTQSVITNVTVQMGPIPWGNKNYWAVDIELTVNEKI